MSADIAQNLWSLVCSSLYSYWTFDLFPLLIFFSKWLLSALNSICLPHLLCSLYDNGFPLFLWSPSGLLCWWIFIVPEVFLNLVYLSIFSLLAALMSADIAQNLWSLVCSSLNSYWTFHLFPLLIFFFKLVAFCTEYNLFTPICFVLFMIMDLPFFCDHQMGYSAGGYSLSPRCFLTWYIYPFFQDSLHWWVLILHKTYDHWSVALFTVTEHLIYSHFWFFFQSGCFLHWIQSVYPICFVLFMIMDFRYFCDHQVGYSAGGYSLSPRCFLTWYIYPFFQDLLHRWVLILHKTYDHWSVALLTVTEHFIYSHFWFFFQIGCFLHWIQSVYPHLLCSLYDNGSPLYLWSPSGLLSWWIFVVLEVVLNLVYLPIFSGLAHWWELILHENYDHWSVAFLTVTENFIYSHFSFFFKLVAFCTEINLFTPICFVII